jgi:hypothetical protein
MCPSKVLTILILIFIIYSYSQKKEKFSQKELKKKVTEVYDKKYLFTSGINYTGVKNRIEWVDPIIYNDIYKLSLKENLTINNLESVLYNSIK